MKAYDVKKLSYRDELARRNRLFFILKLSGFVFGFLVLVGGGTYFLFFTDSLGIKDITINGLETVEQDIVLAEINGQFDYKKFGHLQTKKNIIFFDADTLEADLLSANPVLKSVQAGKHLPHRLVIDIVEREPAGIWCSNNECRYFDDEMQTWGPAVRSSGFLFLTVEDERSREKFGIEEDFFRAINEVVGGLPGLTVKTVIIPENSFDEFRIYTDKDFYLIFSLGVSIKNQLEVLKIFLEEKTKDPNFHPQYIDLRIEGRIYYK